MTAGRGARTVRALGTSKPPSSGILHVEQEEVGRDLADASTALRAFVHRRRSRPPGSRDDHLANFSRASGSSSTTSTRMRDGEGSSICALNSSRAARARRGKFRTFAAPEIETPPATLCGRRGPAATAAEIKSYLFRLLKASEDGRVVSESPASHQAASGVVGHSKRCAAP